MSQILSEHWVLFRRQWEYLRNINTGIELATLSSKNSVSGISKVVYSRRSDRGTPQRDVRRRKKKKTPRGWGRGESEGTRSPLSPSFPPYFSLAIPSRRTPLSERLEQAISKDPPRILGGGLLRPGDGTEISGIDTRDV